MYIYFFVTIYADRVVQPPIQILNNYLAPTAFYNMLYMSNGGR